MGRCLSRKPEAVHRLDFFRDHPVWLKYCVTSRGLAMIVGEQSTEALPSYHWTRVATQSFLPHD